MKQTIEATTQLLYLQKIDSLIFSLKVTNFRSCHLLVLKLSMPCNSLQFHRDHQQWRERHWCARLPNYLTLHWLVDGLWWTGHQWFSLNSGKISLAETRTVYNRFWGKWELKSWYHIILWKTSKQVMVTLQRMFFGKKKKGK